jgi:hypothetical protein
MVPLPRVFPARRTSRAARNIVASRRRDVEKMTIPAPAITDLFDPEIARLLLSNRPPGDLGLF